MAACPRAIRIWSRIESLAMSLRARASKACSASRYPSTISSLMAATSTSPHKAMNRLVALRHSSTALDCSSGRVFAHASKTSEVVRALVDSPQMAARSSASMPSASGTDAVLYLLPTCSSARCRGATKRSETCPICRGR